jgi:hypothetical protein
VRLSARGFAPALCLALAAMAGCSRHFDVPAPAVAGESSTTIPPAERAVIAVPVTIAMSRLLAQTDSVFPATDSLDRSKCSSLGGFVCHQYVYRRDTLDLSMTGDRLTLFMKLRFRGRVALPGVGGIASCGYEPEAMRRAEFRMATSLYWRTDWRLASRGTVMTPEILDPCQVTVLRVDATPLMRKIVTGQVTKFRQQFDSIVPAVADLRPAADSLWRMLQKPFALDSTSTIWLNMTPEGASLAPLVGSSAAITTGLVMTAKPRVVVGNKPNLAGKALPSLTLAGASGGIHVPLDIELPFDALSQRATALLAGEIAGKGIAVKDVTVWGANDTAVVKVRIEGKMSGALYLVGSVSYDAATRAVLIPNLRYTLESTSKMSSIKATLGAPRIHRALDQATGHGRLAIGEQLDRFKAQLGSELNRELAPGVTLAGAVNDVRIEHLYTTPTAFVLRVVFDGAASIDVK